MNIRICICRYVCKYVLSRYFNYPMLASTPYTGPDPHLVHTYICNYYECMYQCIVYIHVCMYVCIMNMILFNSCLQAMQCFSMFLLLPLTPPPNYRFTIGSLESFNVSDLVDQLRTYYNKRYSANLVSSHHIHMNCMCLC